MIPKFEYGKGTATVDLQAYINLQSHHEALIKEKYEPIENDRTAIIAMASAIVVTLDLLEDGGKDEARKIFAESLHNCITDKGITIKIEYCGKTITIGKGKKNVIVNGK